MPHLRGTVLASAAHIFPREAHFKAAVATCLCCANFSSGIRQVVQLHESIVVLNLAATLSYAVRTPFNHHVLSVLARDDVFSLIQRGLQLFSSISFVCARFLCELDGSSSHRARLYE